MANDSFADLEAAYLRGEYAEVLQSGARLAAAPAAQSHADHVWYLMGMAALQLRQPDDAQQAFQQLLDHAPKSRWRPEAEVGLADAAWLAGDAARAVTLYQAALAHLGPGHSVAPRAQYQLGLAARAAGQWETARTALQAVATQAPASFEAALARTVLQEGEFAFSVQVGAFGVLANAVRLQQELVRRGYPATVDQWSTEGRTMHRVRVGRFSRREEAQAMARQLSQAGFPSKVVP